MQTVSRSPVEGAINSLSKELHPMGVEFSREPIFKRQGNFTIAHVWLKRRGRYRKEFFGEGVSKRNCKDKKNPTVGQIQALKRAVFGDIGAIREMNAALPVEGE